jgi:hypothetical protein
MWCADAPPRGGMSAAAAAGSLTRRSLGSAAAADEDRRDDARTAPRGWRGSGAIGAASDAVAAEPPRAA